MGNEWGCFKKIDITNLYKPEEGSKFEKHPVYNAAKSGLASMK